jgi:uncharacterized repeat protein (TIGR03803 family)
MTLRAWLTLLTALLAPLTAAPVFEHVASFEQPGRQPMAPLLHVPADGNLYGTTNDGGTGGKGTVFRMTADGTITTLVNFTGTGGAFPGANPSGGLVAGADGALYGVTLGGGGADYGTIFKVTLGGGFTSLVQFNGVTAAPTNPKGSLPNELTLHSDGFFYGSTQAGGASNLGTVFRYAPGTNTVTTLIQFTGTAGNSKGSQPVGALVASGTFLFGVTSSGGGGDYGTVFRLGVSSIIFTTLVEFTGFGGARPGGNPAAGLMLHPDSMLYGTAETGGLDDVGVVFKVSQAGAYTVLRQFADADGAYPAGRLAVGADLAIYGTTTGGGAEDEGTVFKMTTGGVFTALVQFTGEDGAAPGAAPAAGLILTPGGEFFGTTSAGGAGEEGGVFKLSASGVFTHMASFTNATGWEPAGAPVADGPDSMLIAMKHGGTLGEGTLVRIQPGLPPATIENFGGLLGEEPEGGLSLIGAKVFGATGRGGPSNRGTIYSYSPAGGAATFGTFTTYGGITPESPLTEGPDGMLYAVAQEGGGYGKGAIVRFTANGVRQTLMSFTGVAGGAPGQRPRAPLAFDASGNLYGVTEFGGASDRGTVFRLGPTGTFTTLAEFSTAGLHTPRAGLVPSPDGSLLGTTAFGGTAGAGGVFRITEAGGIVVLAEFNGSNGARPSAALVVAVDGTVYGTTNSGGNDNRGTVFRLTAAGSLERLVSFTGSNGSAPGAGSAGGLAFGSDGTLLGATHGGPGGGGTVFRIRQFGPHVATESASSAPGHAILRGRANTGGEATATFFEYGATPALGLNTLLTPGVVTLGGVTRFDAPLPAIAGGQTVYFRAVAINASGASYGQILTFTAPRAIDVWNSQYFGNTPVNMLEDADGDGKSNLLEYALATNPLEPDSNQPAATLKQYPDGRRLAVIVRRDASHNDITINVEVASSLTGPWMAVATSMNGAPFTGPGYVGGDDPAPGIKQVEIRDTATSASMQQRLMRVRVTQ